MKVIDAHLKHDNQDVNAKDNNGTTALMVASKKSNLKVVDELLKHHKSDVNAKKEDGATALMMASDAGHVEVIYKLLNSNCDLLNHSRLNASDVDEGGEDISVASWNGYSEIGLSFQSPRSWDGKD